MFFFIREFIIFDYVMLSFELTVKIVDFGIELLVKRLLEDVNLGFSEGLSFFFFSIGNE